jgi:hypothetical protein
MNDTELTETARSNPTSAIPNALGHDKQNNFEGDSEGIPVPARDLTESSQPVIALAVLA